MDYEFDLVTDDSCSCKGSNMDKLIQPSILIMLSKHEKLHGYAIIQELEKNEPNGVDKAGIYRTLRTMEERKHIRSEWQNEEDKPSKKMFSLTKEGYYCLYNWISTLGSYRLKLNKIIEDGNKALTDVKKGSGEVKLWNESE